MTGGAIDAALQTNFPCGGWCPEGRIAEDGKIHKKYPLQELEGGSYKARTIKNVENSDGTLIIFQDELAGGSVLTYHHAISAGKSVFLFNFSKPENIGKYYILLQN